MKYLIVNADDLGATPGITRGILEAHTLGIVTSASLMVDTRWSEHGAAAARQAPGLSVGLHVVLDETLVTCTNGTGRSPAVEIALRRQYARFTRLMGRAPSHIDSHHDAHRHPARIATFRDFARDLGLPLRGASAVRTFSRFYGQWGGESHPEHVGVESLTGLLAREVADGVTEMSCHPGYVDAHMDTGYAFEREVELRTLCDPRIRAAIAAHGITLVSFDDLRRLAPVGVGE
ncbi:MAG TPA: ChbG/HpnK family deacetylase [Candidatus Eisenbacteria bacterium]|nr:ChbG/HpnK family deacetylase [Candidatus Eisenbacteria bacterium]